MRSVLFAALVALALPGCLVGSPRFEPGANPVLITYQNPMLVPSQDPEQVWEIVASVIVDYFKIAREEPARLLGGTLTEGRLDTYPEIASTILEPWRHDSADRYEKIESTLQTIRRRAQIRVIPGQGGFWIDVAVFKELEDVRKPAQAAAAAATFRHDQSLTRIVGVVGEQEINKGWIPMGRDPALEQRILAQLAERFGLGVPAVTPIRISKREGSQTAKF
jgi:hypothetical protein